LSALLRPREMSDLSPQSGKKRTLDQVAVTNRDFMSRWADEGEFTEGHELPGKWKVPKEMVGRRLSQEEAKTDHQLLLNCQLAHYRAGFKVVVRFKDEAVVLAFWNFLDDARSKIECVVVRCVRWPQGHEDPEDDDADYRHQN